MITLISALWGLGTAGLAWYCATAAHHITYTTLADGRREERNLPLLFRVTLPLTPFVIRLFRSPGSERNVARTGRDIVAAGYEGVIAAEELLSLQLLIPLLVGPFWCALVLWIAAHTPGRPGLALQRYDWIFAVLGVLLLALYPRSWLRQSKARRHRSIQRSLPFVLDLLTLAVESGMDFMSGLQRTVDRGVINPLNEELMRVTRQIQLGKTRREAMRDLMARVNQPDLSSVFGAIILADELGVSLGSILRIQADQVRRKRFERAEKLANEAPVKLLFPLIFFIFPAVFLILLGPVVMQMLRTGF